MADVGVLELQIQDNGKAAGGGLTSLYNALSKVQKAVGNGLDLSGVATQVTTLAQTINAAKGTSTVVKNLGTLFNAISKFSNIKDFKINKQPFEDLRAAVGEGFNIGTAGTQINALRTALTEGWGDGSGIAAIKEVHNVAKGIGKNDATKIRDMADAVSKYAKSIEELRNASNGVGDWRMMMGGASSSKITGPLSDDNVRVAPVMKPNLQQFADSGLDEVKKATEPIAEGFEYVERSVSEATASVNNFASSSKEALTASKNIKNLISYLDAGENRKSRGFSHVVDAYTGVSKPLTNLAEESAKAFDDKFFERIDRVDHFFESLDKPKSSMEWSSEAFDKILGVGHEMEKISDETSSMFNIPAMDKEGPFKYAYEEIQYYSEKLSEAQTAMNTFDEAAKRIQKDMKFKGSTEAQEKDLARMNESFYAAYEEAEKYKEALDGVLGYANQYSETVGEVTQATQAQAEAVREVVSTTEDADKLANRLQNIVTLAESWKSIPKDQRGDFFNIFKTDPLTTGVLEKLQDLKGDNLGEFAARIREIVESSAEGTDKVAQLNELLQTFGTTQPAEALAESVNKTAGALDNAGKAAQGFANAVHGMNGLATLAESSMGEVERLVGMSDIDLMTMKLDALKHALAEDISTGRLDSQQMAERAMTIKHLTEKIEELKDAQNGLNGRVKSGKSGWDSFTDGLKKAFPLIERIRSQFGRIVLRRALTAVIRQIAAGFKEGVQNVYEYSKAVGTEFAPAMDSAASALAQMKNSIGAAVAPAIQALIPLLQTVVSWFITAVNYVNQFFALLNGQATWTHALPQTVKAFGKQEKAAKGAANAMKDLLADWDELNIIQSNTTGGAGGGAAQAAEDYLSMFEEVGHFDNKVKEIVDFVKDNFEQIKKIALDIGAAVLAWKFSTAFTGILSTITGIAAAGLITKLVFDVSTLFTNEYLETSNPAYLIADLLTTIVGGFFSKKILDKVIGGGVGKIAIPLTFAVSAGATIIANVEHTEIDAFSKEGLLTELLAALEGGVAAGYLAHMMGASIGSSLLGGAVGLIATFGIAVGLKANAKVSAEGITPDAIAQKLVGVGSLGIAGAVAGAKLGAMYGVGAAAGAAGLGMLFMGIPVATFGVSIGINAINETVDARGITPEVIKDNLIAGGLVGAGLAIGTIALAGGAVAGLVGIGGAVATIAALFAIEAIIAEDHVTVKWGDYEATEEQVRSYVSGLFNISPDAVFSVIDPVIEVASSSEEGLTATVEEVKLTAKKITLNIGNTTDALKDLEKKIFGDSATGSLGLIDQFKETAKAKQNVIETSFTLVPTETEDGETAKLIDESSKVWKDLTDHMDTLGASLADHLHNAYSDKLDENAKKDELETVAQYLQMITNVAEAITKGESWADAVSELEDNIGNLSKGSYDKIFDYIDEYKKNITESFAKAYDAGTREMSGQVRGLKESMNNALRMAGGDETNEDYLYYKQEYEYWHGQLMARIEGRKDAIERATENAMDEDTLDILRQSVISKIEGLPNEMDVKQAFRNAGIDTGMDGSIDEFFRGLFDENGNAVAGAATKQKAFVSGLVETMFGEDADTIMKMMDIGLLDLADIIPNEMMERLTSNLLQNTNDPVVKDAMMKFFSGNFSESDVKQYTKTADDVADIIRKEYADALNRGDASEIERVTAGLYGTYNKDLVESIMDEVDATITVTVSEVEIEDPKNVQDEIRKAVEEALEGGPLDSSQADSLINGLIGTYGSEYEEYIEDLVDELDDAFSGTSGKINPNRITASGAFSDTRPSRSYVNGSQAAEVQMDQQSMTNSVESGTKKANAVEEDLIRQLVRVVEQIARKDFTVNVSPSAAWGGMNVKSGIARARVTGGIPEYEA